MPGGGTDDSVVLNSFYWTSTALQNNPTDAEGVLQDPLALTIEAPDAQGEPRYVAIGLGSSGDLLVVVYAERGEQYRLISSRRATRKERKAYEG